MGIRSTVPCPDRGKGRQHYFTWRPWLQVWKCTICGESRTAQEAREAGKRDG